MFMQFKTSSDREPERGATVLLLGGSGLVGTAIARRLLDFQPERLVISGLMREDVGAEAAPFDEVWHRVKPRDDSRIWAIAGIQQRQ